MIGECFLGFWKYSPAVNESEFMEVKSDRIILALVSEENPNGMIKIKYWVAPDSETPFSFVGCPFLKKAIFSFTLSICPNNKMVIKRGDLEWSLEKVFQSNNIPIDLLHKFEVASLAMDNFPDNRF